MNKISPIVIIPGLKGNNLVTGEGSTLWSPDEGIETSFYDLMLDIDGVSDAKKGINIKAGTYDKTAYQDFIDFTTHKLDVPIRVFVYDWRKSAKENAVHLRDFLFDLKFELKCEEFNFVCHSGGGLVLQAYMALLEGDFSNMMIDKAVFVAVPFNGTVMAMEGLVVGDNAATRPYYAGFDLMLFGSSRVVIRTFPFIYEMLPFYEGSFVKADKSQSQTKAMLNIFNGANWQSNLSSNTMVMKRLEEALRVKENFYPLDLLPPDVASRFLSVSAVGTPTSNKVVVHDNSPTGRVKNFFDFSSMTTQGDGTVAAISANAYAPAVTTLGVSFFGSPKQVHRFILCDSRVQTVVKRFLIDDKDCDPWYSVIGGTVEKVF